MARARFPLRLEIALFAAGLITLAVGGLSIFTVYLPWRQKLAAQANLARALVEPVATSIVRLTSAGPRWNTSVVQDFVANPATVRRGLEVVYALLYDEKGNLDEVASVANPELLERSSPRLAALYLRDPARCLRLFAAGEEGGLQRFNISLTMEDRSTKVGKLELGVSTAAIDAEARQGLLRELAILGATLILGVTGAFAMGERIARPLAQLAAAMGRLEKGDFSGDLPAAAATAAATRDEVGALARAFTSMLIGLRQRERLRGTLGRYVSGDVAKRILEEQDDLALQGELLHVTVLFLDVRGFTTVSERLGPGQVVELLNEYFQIVVERVQAHGGSVNKFIGDAAMCIWGAPRALPEPERGAVLAALEIQEKARALSLQRSALGLTAVGLGIGINSGEVVAGNLGAAERLEYTVIGDAVNLAQRLESQAREGEVLVSEGVYERVSALVDALPREAVKLKGKSQPVPLWLIRGLRGSAEPAVAQPSPAAPASTEAA